MLPTRTPRAPGRHSTVQSREDDAYGCICPLAGMYFLSSPPFSPSLPVYAPSSRHDVSTSSSWSPHWGRSTLTFFFPILFHPQIAKWEKKESKEITLADFPIAGVAPSPGSAFSVSSSHDRWGPGIISEPLGFCSHPWMEPGLLEKQLRCF